MVDIDYAMALACEEIDGIYRRYSDDILFIIEPQHESLIFKKFETLIKSHGLKINENKTERVVLDSTSKNEFQYLGFQISRAGAFIRPSSMSRQWRKLNRAIRRIKKLKEDSKINCRKNIISTKKLCRKFSPTGARNFPKYARKASKSFNSPIIKKQALRLERSFHSQIKEILP